MDWSRSARAVALYAGRKTGLEPANRGRLARWRLNSRNTVIARWSNILAADKLRQMLSASLEAYHSGSDHNTKAREQIVLDISTRCRWPRCRVLAKSRSRKRLRVWFANGPSEVRTALEQAEPTPEKAPRLPTCSRVALRPACTDTLSGHRRRALESRIRMRMPVF